MSEILPLDPAPWSWVGRSSSPGDDNANGEGWVVFFDPRPGYAQDRALYGPVSDDTPA